MSEQGDDETTPKKRRRTSTTSTSVKEYFSKASRMSNEKPSHYDDILTSDSIIERWDDEKNEFDNICAQLNSYFKSSP